MAPHPTDSGVEFTSPRLTIRTLCADDAPLLQRVFTAAGDHFLTITGRPAPDADAADREIRGATATAGREIALIHLRDSGDAIGAAGWWAGNPEPDVALLGMLVVVPEHRGGGIAREALGALEHHLAAQGICHIRSAAGAGDQRAHDILHALGFAPLEQRRHIGLDRGRIMVALFEKPLVGAADAPKLRIGLRWTTDIPWPLISRVENAAPSRARLRLGTSAVEPMPAAPYPFADAESPRGEVPTDALRFVIQKHDASHLHFDFRLEMEGTMRSWAVPKGPSLDPSVKRLAVQVGDHPVSYNTFEGVIPADEYGGGTVMVWDRGTYAAAAAPGRAVPLAEQHRRGRVDFVLHGERLHGAFTLVRTRRAASKPQWLLFKRSDAFASTTQDPVAQHLTSVASGRTMTQIARGTHTQPEPRKAATSGPELSQAGTALLARLSDIEAEGGDGAVRVGRGKSLNVTSLDKVYFPEPGYTKGELMRYYMRVSPYLLPLLRSRPLSLKRYPNGVAGEFFFQQKAPEHAPAAVRVETIRTAAGEPAERLVGGGLATLLYLIQLGCISLDPWHTRVGAPDGADYAVLDLDPGPEAPFSRVVQVARWIGEALEAAALHGAVKTSGATGIHIYLPLPPHTSAEQARALAEHIATRIAAEHPKEVTLERSLGVRAPDAVYVDFGQNDPGKTVAAAYAVRAEPEATVSTPLDWDELTPHLDPRRFTLATMPERLERVGDLWTPAMRKKNRARAITRVLEA